MLKSLFNWKVLLNLLLAIVVFIGLIWLTFRWLEQHTKHGEETPVPNVVNKSVYDAVKILEDVGLEYEVDSATYDPKYRPFQVLKMSPTAGSRVKDGRAIQLRVNPKTWAPVAVPDIINKYSGLAFQRISQVGLKVGDTIYEPSIQKDAVIRMLFQGNDVKPGTLIPRFSAIDVVVGSGPMRNISIPNVIGLTVKEARAAITRNLFEIGLVDHEDGTQDESDIVYYQDPAGGDVRDQGMQIDLWASKKTLAELQSKVSQLNSIYRMKVDTSASRVQYEETPMYPEPIHEAPKHTEPVKIEAPKNGVSAENKPKVSPTPNSSNSGIGSRPVASPPTEKPKPKKVVVE